MHDEKLWEEEMGADKTWGTPPLVVTATTLDDVTHAYEDAIHRGARPLYTATAEGLHWVEFPSELGDPVKVSYDPRNTEVPE